MTDHMETWRCPECGKPSYYWHFGTPDGSSLIADLPSLPDFSALAQAKETALAEHERTNPDE